MKKPLAEDLRGAAEFLNRFSALADNQPQGFEFDSAAASRVATYLNSIATDSDRQRARKAGVSVKYLRDVLDKGR